MVPRDSDDLDAEEANVDERLAVAVDELPLEERLHRSVGVFACLGGVPQYLRRDGIRDQLGGVARPAVGHLLAVVVVEKLDDHDAEWRPNRLPLRGRDEGEEIAALQRLHPLCDVGGRAGDRDSVLLRMPPPYAGVGRLVADLDALEPVVI